MSLRTSLPGLLGLIALGMVACGEEGRVASDAPSLPNAPLCAKAAFTAEQSSVEVTTEGMQGIVSLSGFAGDLTTYTNFSQLSVEIYKMAAEDGTVYTGPLTPGTYKLEDIGRSDSAPLSYANCSLCVVLAESCRIQGKTTLCGKTYFATSGTVTIDVLGFTYQSDVRVSLHNLNFFEVNMNTGRLTGVGSKRCMASSTLSAVVETGVIPVTPATNTQTSCSEAGNGSGLGNNIRNITLKNCVGEDVTLHSIGCGKTPQALWLATSAQWCAPCKAFDPLYYDLARQNDAIDFYVILGQLDPVAPNMNTETILQQRCATGFGDTHTGFGISNVPPSHVLIDPEWTQTDQLMNDYKAPGIPYSRILRGGNMEYLWSENAERVDGTLPHEKDALKEAAGVSEINGWTELQNRLRTLTGP